ncbi:hypothetical protein ACFXDE_29005 [Kitasatospora sp. NPDC059408]|uniref:hypothetical protein n=1 Tax=Kitasatospora sp. NPDC059408 TaxID=3346823 RepID=UPI00368949B1
MPGTVLHNGTTDGTLLNPQSAKCLNTPDFSLTSAPLAIWDCNATTNQVWILRA